jgi:hypothetical protein
MIRRLALTIGAALSALALAAPAAVAATGYIENSPYSKTVITVDNYCYAAKLGSTTALLYPGHSTTYYDRGFRVPTGHQFSVWKNGGKYISNVTSQGNAICFDGSTGVFVLVQN